MADTYLSRTPSSAGNQQIWTLSAWIKKSKTGTANQNLFSQTGGGSTSQRMYVLFSDDLLVVSQYNGSSSDFNYTSSALFRDPAAWYHLVVSVDTTQATDSNRVKIYMNGEQITSFSSTTHPSQSLNTYVNTTQVIGIGHDTKVASRFFDGYMAEMHLTDGTAYAPSTFGETDTTGVWIPKVGPSVTYGTNGFYLKFENSGAMGTDSSGNSNTFSVGGGTVRQVPDSPTNVFPTLNPLLVVSPTPTLSKGNLQSTPSGNGNHTTGANISIPENSGKWYAETVLTYVSNQSGAFTIQDVNNVQSSSNTYSGQYSVFWQASGTDYFATRQGGSSEDNSTSTTISVGDIFQIAYDSTNGKVWFGRNNTWITGNPSTDTTPTYSSITGDKVFTTTGYRVTSGSSYTAQLVNFGQDSSFGGNKTAQNNADGNGKGDFYYAPPTGFLALCTDNLSSALTIPVNKGSDNFNPVTYTGTGSTQSITGVGFQPDWVWIKRRNAAAYHQLFDSVRGATKALFSNYTGPEAVDANNLQSFASDGFTAGGFVGTNGNGDTYVAWNWKAGGTAPSNTYVVKVVSDNGNKYRFDDFGTSAITLELQEGGTFTFDQSDNSNSGHPLRFSTTANGTHGGGTEYTTGVTTNGTPGQAGAYTRITVAAGAPTLYYYCTQHSGMGGQANTGSLFGFTNVKGTLQGVVSPNTTAGFSIITYTGNGTAGATIGHGLGQAPDMTIIKRRSATETWITWHTAFNSAQSNVRLESTGAVDTASPSMFNNTFPTSTLITLGNGNFVNTNTETYVCYAFKSIEGYSKFGSYTGNGNADGTFVYTGFRPAFCMWKRTDTTGAFWQMIDTTRDTFNVMDSYLQANANSAEASFPFVDFLSNGFKHRHNSTHSNASGGTYIYMAFAENPFVTSTGKPVTAR